MKFSTTLKNNFEFRRLYARGKSSFSRYAAVYYRKNRSSVNKLGITVSKKVGKAVQRNKIRRRFKEIYRTNEELFARGYDIVVVARTSSRLVRYDELEADLMKLFRKLGLCGSTK